MLQLLSPIGLAALAAIAVPAILHLWRPPAKTIRVGSLRFFTGPAVRRLTKLRWRERLLLAVRVLLLTLLAVLLAQPIWNRKPPREPQRWAVLEPGARLTGEALKRWRELESEGFEPRQLAQGFPPASLHRGGPAAVTATDTWSLLREADARLPAGSTIAVFGTSRLASLRGERPTLTRSKVEWIATESNESSPHVWISSVQLLPGSGTSAQSLRVAVSNSSASVTDQRVVSLPAAAGKTAIADLPGWSIEVNGGSSARLLHDDNTVAPGSWIAATSAQPLNVALLPSADRAEDARYVEAALRAIAEVSGQAVNVRTDATRADWVFWLNEDPVPAEIVRDVTSRGGNLLSDAEDSRGATTARQPSSIAAEGLNGEMVSLFRRTPASDDLAASVWRDGFGIDLLTVAAEGAGRRWRFFSRFHPDWNDLPRSSALAAVLRPLLATNDLTGASTSDLRRAHANQSRPAEATAHAGDAAALAAATERVDLHNLLWYLCVALFALERVLSYRRSAAPPENARTAPREEPVLSHV